MARGGVFKSTNNGNRWVFQSKGISTLSIRSLAVDRAVSGTLWTVANFTLFRSTDGGAAWSRVLPGPAIGSFPSQVVLDPLDSSNVYVLMLDGTLRRSHDRGLTWEIAGNPGNQAGKLVIDPLTPTTLYAAGVGVVKSTDGGTSWTPLPVQPFDLQFYDLVISPSSPSTLYLSGADLDFDVIVPRLMQTTDGGATWDMVEEDALVPPRVSLAVDPQVHTTLYSVYDGFVYRSVDGGGSWSVFNDSMRNVFARLIAMSPEGNLYLAAGFENVFEIEGAGPWDPLGVSPVESPYMAIGLDTADPCRIYAGTWDRGLMVFTKEDC